MIGKKNRLARIINPKTKRSLILAMDHGMVLGPTKGIENPKETIELLKEWSDALIINKGILSTSYIPDGQTGIVLRISGGPTIAGGDLSQEGITTSIEEALRVSADAVIVNVFVGFESERSTLINLSRIADECHRYGLPLIGSTAVGKDKEKGFDPKYIKLSTRVVAEFGADLIKTYYTETKFDEVVACCPVPILIAGGPHLDSDEQVFKMVHESIQKGAAGIAMGRNIWQNNNAVGMIKALHGIIHKGYSVEDAIQEYKK